MTENETKADDFDPPYGSSEEDLRPNSIVIKEAEEAGLTVVRPGVDELQLDLDTDADYHHFIEMMPFVCKHFSIMKYRCRTSRSGLPARHVTVTLKDDISIEAKIALQACLGSDRKRELFNLRRTLNGEKDSILFFEKKV